MRNSPRSSVTVAAVAAATLVGLSSDSAEAILDEDRSVISSNGSTIPYERHTAITGCPAEKTQELVYKLQLTERELNALRAQTKAQTAQIAGLLMERDTAEAVCATACEDEDRGTPGSHESGM